MSRKRGHKEKSQLDYRYGGNWSIISIEARRQSPTCCYCCVKPATLTHHVRYVNDEGELLLDNVQIGVDVFPVCEQCHRKVHSNLNYRTHERVELNHNTKTCIQQLKLGFALNRSN